MLNCAILGYGTVGTGVYKLLTDKENDIFQKSGSNIRVKWVYDRSFRRIKDYPLPSEICTKDPNVIFNDPDVHCVIELIGGIEPARTFIYNAIRKGKHVVTANKAVLSASGPEIWKEAESNGVLLGYEASVGGGVPVIKTVKESLVGNRISTIVGIMNGTANYILSRMTKERKDYYEILKDAQRLGYAEADPTFDVEGYDTAHKLAILSMLTFGQKFSQEDIYTEGITRIAPLDIDFAKELGYRVKLLAIARLKDDGIMLRVHPTMIPDTHLLAQVDGVFNAFYFIGDGIGKMLLYGMGAGQGPTASAVVSDLVDIARLKENCNMKPMHTKVLSNASLKKVPVASLNSRYYFRFSAVDRPGVLAKISGILGEYGISIQSVVQKGRKDKGAVPIVMLTHEASEENVGQALKKIDSLDVTMEKTVLIRIEDLSTLE